MAFRVLPEYFLEDVVDYFLFIVRYDPSRYLLLSHFDRFSKIHPGVPRVVG